MTARELNEAFEQIKNFLFNGTPEKLFEKQLNAVWESMLVWHNAKESLPRNGVEVLIAKKLSNGYMYQVLEYYDGFNCGKNYKECEMKVDYWAYIPDVKESEEK